MKRLLFILPLVIYGCGSSERPDSEVVVDESALSVYTRENYPRTFQKWGDSGIERIKNVERAALFKAGKQTRCDQVEYVGLSEKLSNPPDKSSCMQIAGIDGGITSMRATRLFKVKEPINPLRRVF